MKRIAVSFIIVCFFLCYSASFARGETLTPIMGESECSVAQMYTYLLENNDKNGLNPIDEEYAKKFVLALDAAARSEGVRGDVAFALIMHETGFLNFGGDVLAVQNNFGGLGATGKGAKGTYFDDMETGVLAVVQHLKCYATTEKMNNKIVDPRYSEKLRGKAQYVEYLGYKDNPNNVGWAVPGEGYGSRLISHIERMKKIDAKALPGEQKAPMKELFIILSLVVVLVVLLRVRMWVVSKNAATKHSRSRGTNIPRR